eukprot:6489737-Amphidinium_carterae.2
MVPFGSNSFFDVLIIFKVSIHNSYYRLESRLNILSKKVCVSLKADAFNAFFQEEGRSVLPYVADLEQAPEGPEFAAEEGCSFKRVASCFSDLCSDPHPQVSWASHKTLLRYLRSVAEASLQSQRSNLEHLLQYLLALQRAGGLRLVLLVNKCSFDETPLKLNVSFEKEKGLETSRVLAIESSWGILVKDLVCGSDSAAAYTFYHGHCSPQLKAGDRETGEVYAVALEKCLPRLQHVEKSFDLSVFVAETDEAGANGRALRQLAGVYPDSSLLHIHCLLHKLHSCAAKTFDLFKPELKGISRTLLVLQQPGVFSKLKSVYREDIAQNLEYVEVDELTPLPPAAVAFRETVLRFLKPSRRRPGVLLCVTAEKLFNADWRQAGRFIHRCKRGSGCCSGRDDAVKKMQRWINKLMSGLGNRILNRGNWLAWQECLPLLGVLLAMHMRLPALLVNTLQKAKLVMSRAAALGPVADNMAASSDAFAVEVSLELSTATCVDNSDKIALLRFEQAQHRREAVAWLTQADGIDPLGSVLKLRVACDGEIDMMAQMVAGTCAAAQVQRLKPDHTSQEVQSKQFFVLDVVSGDYVRQMCRTQLEHLNNADIWATLPHTEAEVGTVWRLVLRPAATAFQLVEQMISRFPLRVFRLLLEGAAEEASRLLEARACTLDDFSLQFRNTFGTIEAMTSECARQVLSSVLSMSSAHTFSTEVLHSVNARRCRTRVHTHTPWISQPLLCSIVPLRARPCCKRFYLWQRPAILIMMSQLPRTLLSFAFLSFLSACP